MADKKKSAEERIKDFVFEHWPYERLEHERNESQHKNCVLALITQLATQERAEQKKADAERARAITRECEGYGTEHFCEQFGCSTLLDLATAIERGE